MRHMFYCRPHSILFYEIHIFSNSYKRHYTRIKLSTKHTKCTTSSRFSVVSKCTTSSSQILDVKIIKSVNIMPTKITKEMERSRIWNFYLLLDILNIVGRKINMVKFLTFNEMKRKTFKLSNSLWFVDTIRLKIGEVYYIILLMSTGTFTINEYQHSSNRHNSWKMA